MEAVETVKVIHGMEDIDTAKATEATEAIQDMGAINITAMEVIRAIHGGSLEAMGHGVWQRPIEGVQTDDRPHSHGLRAIGYWIWARGQRLAAKGWRHLHRCRAEI